jgi:hypothetical protein
MLLQRPVLESVPDTDERGQSIYRSTFGTETTSVRPQSENVITREPCFRSQRSFFFNVSHRTEAI